MPKIKYLNENQWHQKLYQETNWVTKKDSKKKGKKEKKKESLNK